MGARWPRASSREQFRCYNPRVMKKYNLKRPRTRNIISWILSLAMIGAGVALIGSFFLAGTNITATNSADPGGFNVPKLEPAQDVGPVLGPEDKTLKLNIPAMSRIEDDAIPNTTGDRKSVVQGKSVDL